MSSISASTTAQLFHSLVVAAAAAGISYAQGGNLYCAGYAAALYGGSTFAGDMAGIYAAGKVSQLAGQPALVVAAAGGAIAVAGAMYVPQFGEEMRQGMGMVFGKEAVLSWAAGYSLANATLNGYFSSLGAPSTSTFSSYT